MQKFTDVPVNKIFAGYDSISLKFFKFEGLVLEYSPSNTQAVVIKPYGKDGVFVVAGDTQRGFGNIDQALGST